MLESSMNTTAVWHGSPEEALELVKCIAHHCACVFDSRGVQTTTCAVHRMLMEDQRALNGLLFGRFIAARLSSEEFAATEATELVLR
jgi:hypothetical protein